MTLQEHREKFLRVRLSEKELSQAQALARSIGRAEDNDSFTVSHLVRRLLKRAREEHARGKT